MVFKGGWNQPPVGQMPFQGPTPGTEGSMVNANGQFDMNAMMMMGMVRKNYIFVKN